MAAEGEKKMITLKSSDGEEFELEEAVAMESQTIRHMIEDDCADNGIPLPNVNSKVIKYCNKHVHAAAAASKAANPSPDGDANSATASGEDLKNWDADFVKVDEDALFYLIVFLWFSHDLDVDPIDVDNEGWPDTQEGDGSTMQSPVQATGSGATAGSSRGKRPAAAPAYPSGSRPHKRVDRDAYLHRLVNLYEKSLTTRMSSSSVMSPDMVSTREDVLRLMRKVKEAGAAPESDEYFYASQLFMKPEYRNSFRSMETNEARLNWVRRTWDLYSSSLR